MHLASIRGKLPIECATEDMLTSNVLGLVSYWTGASEFWRTLLRRCGSSAADWSWSPSPAFEFWPRMSDGGEPDLVLRWPRRVLIVEVKRHAPLAVDPTTGRSQVARYFESIRRSDDEVDELAALLLTGESYFSSDRSSELLHIQAELGPHGASAAWTSWFEVRRVLSSMAQEHRVARDLAGYLVWEGFSWEGIAQLSDVVSLHALPSWTPASSDAQLRVGLLHGVAPLDLAMWENE